MNTLTLATTLLVLSGLAFLAGRKRALGLVAHPKQLGSLPGYYGSYVLLWAVVPAALLVAGWLSAEPKILDALVLAEQPTEVRELPAGELQLFLHDIERLAEGGVIGRETNPTLEAAAATYAHSRKLFARSRTAIALLLALGGALWAWRRVKRGFRAHLPVERALRIGLLAASTIAIFTTAGIVLSLVFEAIRFFRLVPVTDFLFGLEWSPQTALRADQVGSSGAFGAIPLFAGTFLISLIAMLVAVPIGLLSAIFLSEYSAPRVRAIFKPLLEILAGIPTVVYGFFAALTIAPVIRDLGESIGLDVASESALAAGGVMGVMIIPFVSSLSDDALSAVPQGLREASYGLGATRSETIKRVLLPAALPGIIGGILLAVSRAVGETMIVVMAAGLAANPLQAVTTVTVQIVTLLVGDQEFDSAKTLAAFALGLMLFLVTLVLNVIALYVVRTYRQQYE